MITRRYYSGRLPRDEYLRTRAGSAMGTALRELQMWGEYEAR
jgi:DNA-binding HxlR family transcriptional regulator